MMNMPALTSSTGSTTRAAPRKERRGRARRAMLVALVVVSSIAGVTMRARTADAALVGPDPRAIVPGSSYAEVACTMNRLAIQPYAMVQSGVWTGFADGSQYVSYRFVRWDLTTSQVQQSGWSAAQRIPVNNWYHSPLTASYVNPGWGHQHRVWVEVIHWRPSGSSWTYTSSGYREAAYYGYNGGGPSSNCPT